MIPDVQLCASGLLFQHGEVRLIHIDGKNPETVLHRPHREVIAFAIVVHVPSIFLTPAKSAMVYRSTSSNMMASAATQPSLQ